MTKAKFIVVSDGPLREFETLYDALAYVNGHAGYIYEPLASDSARQVYVIEDQAGEIERLRSAMKCDLKRLRKEICES